MRCDSNDSLSLSSGEQIKFYQLYSSTFSTKSSNHFMKVILFKLEGHFRGTQDICPEAIRYQPSMSRDLASLSQSMMYCKLLYVLQY